jgi:hypothetical protein
MTMTDSIHAAADKLRRDLKRLETEAAKVRKALASLEALNGRGEGKRISRARYQKNCSVCGDAFEAKRKDAHLCPKRECRDISAGRRKIKPIPTGKPTTLVKGDSLRA